MDAAVTILCTKEMQQYPISSLKRATIGLLASLEPIHVVARECILAGIKLISFLGEVDNF